ncbi:MAG: AI-2E family transporter [Planctomycetota bacterium]|nr:AI-2E family transporter [Planctomycetota bacterium]
MIERNALPRTIVGLLGFACFVVVVGGMQLAQSLVVPFLLSVFVATLCSPLLFFLTGKGVPNSLAMLLVIVGVLVVCLVAFALLGHSMQDFISNRETYELALNQKRDALLDWLKQWDMGVSKEDFNKFINPEKPLELLVGILNGFRSVLNNAFIIIITVIFILSEWTIFEDKMCVIYKGDQTKIDRFYLMLTKVRRYMALKCMVSLITAICVYILLLIVGVDFPLLWAALAFAFNFIPTIGSIIAGVIPVMLALVQPGLGIWPAIWTTLGYALINGVIGNYIDPKIMGKDLGLSTLVVFLSLVFWGWVLGYVGMLLSVPLTVTAKIMLESSPETRWMAVLLSASSGSSDDPPESPAPSAPSAPSDITS